MSATESISANLKMADEKNQLEFFIAPKKSLFRLLLFLFIIFPIIIGFPIVGYEFFKHQTPFGIVFSIIFSLFLILGEVIFIIIHGWYIRWYIWNDFSTEKITASSDKLKIEKKLFNLISRKEFALNEIKNFRLLSADTHERKITFYGIKVREGTILFDYGVETIRLAGSIEDAEAIFILEKLKEKGFINKARISLEAEEIKDKVLGKPACTKFKEEDLGYQLRFILRPKRDISFSIFLCIVFVGLLTIGIFIFSGFSNMLFVFPWLLIVMTLFFSFCLFLLLAILWSFTGKEVLTFSDKRLKVEWKLFNLSFAKEYSMSKIKNLRIAPIQKQESEMLPGRFYIVEKILKMFNSGAIAFDYDMKTVRFGLSIDESEAVSILEQIKAKGFIK